MLIFHTAERQQELEKENQMKKLLIILTCLSLTLFSKIKWIPEDDKKIIENQTDTNNTEITIITISAEENAKKILTDREEIERKEDTGATYDTSYEVSEYTPTFKNMEELKSYINSEEYKISKIGKEVKALKEEIFTLKSEITSLKTSLGKLSTEINYRKIGLFNAKNLGGYQDIETNCGVFPIKIKDVKSYLEGHKITFSIGNPYSATYEDYKVNITWLNDREKENKQTFLLNDLIFDSEEELDNYINSKNKLAGKKQVNQDFFLTKALLPGKWNDVECFINPSTLDELEYLEVGLNILGTTLSGK